MHEGDIPQGLSFSGTVAVDTEQQMQPIMGFGGAFTEASAINFALLPPAKQVALPPSSRLARRAALTPRPQEEFIEAYWGKTGIGYTLGRIPINSCDFSPGGYEGGWG